jgi:hypothetical protein
VLSIERWGFYLAISECKYVTDVPLSFVWVYNSDPLQNEKYGSRFFKIAISGIKNGNIIHYSSFDPGSFYGMPLKFPKYKL